MKLFVLLYKIIKRIFTSIDSSYSWINTWLKFTLNRIAFSNDFTANGRSIININLKASCTFGKKLVINSGPYHNVIGGQQKCFFYAGPGAKLLIGDHVGISCSAIICNDEIIIEDLVKIGANVAIYDSDFHSLNPAERNNIPEIYNIKTKKVLVKQGAFIGANSIILKGVTIGKNSIVGAGSVVAKDIPDFEIWGGNPACLIKKIDG